MVLQVFEDNYGKLLKGKNEKILYSILMSYINDKKIALTLSLEYATFCDFEKNIFLHDKRSLDFMDHNPIIIG